MSANIMAKIEKEMISQYKMWTREATTILIQQYQVHECLWMTTSPFYRNKQKRSEALINIALAVSKLRPQTTAEDIKNKINGIRTQYVSEINKMLVATSRGEPYEPTLWCFEILSFLKQFTQPKQKRDSRNWNWYYTPKALRPQFATPSTKPQYSAQSQPPEPETTEPPRVSRNCIMIKAENDDDVEIIEEEDTFQTDDDYSSHSSYHHDQEDKTYNEEQENTKEKSSNSTVIEIKSPPTAVDSGFEEDETSRVRKLFSPSGIGAEITLVPKKNVVKRKYEETAEVYVEDKKNKVEAETNTESNELEMRINIFGKFVMSQMNIITDKVLLLKLEHTIQNAIIEAQLKQIQLDEANKEKIDNANQN